ncbi:MAG: glycosyltransferase family 39 protein, partial [Polyangiaceae bacterium]
MAPEKHPSERLLSPEIEARLTQALLVACLAGIAYLFLQIAMFRYGRDQGIYAMVAESIRQGGMPYRDAWDFKPPGIFAVFALARALFGASETGIRLLEIMGLGSVVVAFAIFAARFFGDFRAGIVAGALAVLVHGELEFWHTAQPESFGGMLTAWALVLATFEPREGDARARLQQLAAWAIAGACYGAAFLMKPPLGAGALASSAFVTWRMLQKSEKRSPLDYALPTLVIGAGSAVPILLCVAWYAARGALGDLYEAIFVFAPHYTKLSWEGASVLGAVYLAFEEWFVDLSGPTAA